MIKQSFVAGLQWTSGTTGTSKKIPVARLALQRKRALAPYLPPYLNEDVLRASYTATS